jgi:TolB-like protein
VNPLVAVMPFSNVTGKDDDAWMAIGTSEALNTDLPTIGFTLVERTQLARLLKEEDLGQVLGEAKSHEMAKKLGADFLVLGSVMHANKAVRADCRFVDVGTSVVVQTFSEEGKDDELTQVLGRLSAAIARRFNTRLTDEELKKLSGNRLSKDEFERLARQQLLESQLVKKKAQEEAHEEKASESRRPVMLAGAGVLGGAVLAGAGFIVAAQASANTAYIEGLQNFATTPADVARYKADHASAQTATVAWTAVGVGGLLLAGGSAAYLAWRELNQAPAAATQVEVKQASREPKATVTPALAAGPGQVAVGVTGTF